MRGFIYIFLFFVGLVASGQDETVVERLYRKEPVNGIRIAWDHSTLKQLTPPDAKYSGYARMIKLRDGSLFCVYESDKAIHAIKSTDGGKHWNKPMVLAVPRNNIACSVPEVLQLQDESILVSYNQRPPADNADPAKRFSIQVIRSTNGGQHWSKPVEVYKAGYEFKNGCWEPAQIQLLSGEIQLYIANEGPYTQSNEQEITMFRSTDQGTTWTKGETVSFRRGHRDGMPVPLLLKNPQEIILAIEDNGIDGNEFKPVIIRLPANVNPHMAPVLATDAARAYAMDTTVRIPAVKYAGAPYIRQLPSGEVLLSYQGNELRKDFQWDRSDMIVAIGSAEGKNFNRRSTPFYISDPSKTALWNSLCVENDGTVIALASTNAYGKMAVWMIKGKVMGEIKSSRAALTVDGEKNEAVWKTQAPVFIGGFDATQANINTAWDEDQFFLLAEVRDKNVITVSADSSEDDAVRFFLDPENRSLTLPDENIFSLTVTAGGKCFFREGKNGSWIDWRPSGIIAKSKITADGYRLEVAIPWTSLRYKPKTNARIGFHASILETSTGTPHTYEEGIAGNIRNASYSWSPLFLMD